jgi:hypothetical protein
MLETTTFRTTYFYGYTGNLLLSNPDSEGPREDPQFDPNRRCLAVHEDPTKVREKG